MKLNYKKMLEDILEKVDNDWCADMEVKAVMPDQIDFSQEEARFMATMLAEIYGISHCLRCEGCQTKYII